MPEPPDRRFCTPSLKRQTKIKSRYFREKTEGKMGFAILIIMLLLMLIPLGFSAERVFSRHPIPRPLLVTTSVVTGLWGGLLTADLLAGSVVGTGLCGLMLIAQRLYNRRYGDRES